MYFFKTYSHHTEEVKNLQKQVSASKNLLSLERNLSSNTLRNGDYKNHALRLDLSSLNKALAINVEERWVDVEPRMTFFDLCKATFRYGFIPPVVPEFASITVGGAVMGAAIESGSHRFGQVSDNCLEYELILGNGELITCSPKEHPDLFYALSGSYGTFGILTRIKMRLTKAERFVHLTYRLYDTIPDAISSLASSHAEDFVEAIAFDRSHITMVTGKMTSNPSYPLVRQTNVSPWYYQYVQGQANHNEAWMPLMDYLFRLDRGAFWMGRFLASFPLLFKVFFGLRLEQINFSKEKGNLPGSFFRLLFGWAFSSKRLYKIWHKVPNAVAERLFFIHDFYSPVSKAEAALNHFLDQTGIYPVWLCPVKGTKTPQFLSPHFGEENFINIGLYGIPHSQQPIPQLTAALEQDILGFGGRKMLYSLTYYDEALFAKIYNTGKYEALRKKFYAADSFPTLYNKVCKKC